MQNRLTLALVLSLTLVCEACGGSAAGPNTVAASRSSADDQNTNRPSEPPAAPWATMLRTRLAEDDASLGFVALAYFADGDFFLVHEPRGYESRAFDRRRVTREGGSLVIGAPEAITEPRNQMADFASQRDGAPFCTLVRMTGPPRRLIAWDPSTGRVMDVAPLDDDIEDWNWQCAFHGERGVAAGAVPSDGGSRLVAWTVAGGPRRHDLGAFPHPLFHLCVASAGAYSVVAFELVSPEARVARIVRFENGAAAEPVYVTLPPGARLEQSVGIRADGTVFLIYRTEDATIVGEVVGTAIEDRASFPRSRYPLASDVRLMSCNDVLWGMAFGLEGGVRGFLDVLDVSTDGATPMRVGEWELEEPQEGGYTSRFGTDAVAVCGPRSGLVGFKAPDVADPETAYFVGAFGIP